MMNLLMKKSLMTAALLASCGLCAAEAPTPAPSEFAKAQEQVKAKFPEEYAKLQKLAETDLMGAMEQLRELAGKGNISLPRRQMDFRNRRGMRDGMPGRDRGGMMPGGDRGGRGGGPGMGAFTLLAQLKTAAAIKAKFPQEYSAAVTGINAAEKQYEELAVKAGAEATAPAMRELRQLEAKNPAGFDEVITLAGSDARAAVFKLRELAAQEGIRLSLGGRRDGRGGGGNGGFNAPRTRINPAMRMKQLRENFPEEMKKYDELRGVDRNAANALLRELNRKLTVVEKEKSAPNSNN